MVNYSKEDYVFMARRRGQAFKQIAEKLGKDHQITKMMGSRAWGRDKFETGPDVNLRNAIESKAALDGAFDILNMWARDNDPGAQRIMLSLYPMSYEHEPGNKGRKDSGNG